MPPARMPRLKSKRPVRSKKKQPVGDPELQRLLDNVVGSTTDTPAIYRGQAFAQVLDNDAIKRLKKKVVK